MTTEKGMMNNIKCQICLKSYKNQNLVNVQSQYLPNRKYSFVMVHVGCLIDYLQESIDDKQFSAKNIKKKPRRV